MNETNSAAHLTLRTGLIHPNDPFSVPQDFSLEIKPHQTDDEPAVEGIE